MPPSALPPAWARQPSSSASEPVTARPDISAEEARAICQRLLDATGRAYLERDFAAYASNYAVPSDLHSFGAVRLVADIADLHELFAEILAYFDSIGLTSLKRECLSAEVTRPDTISASFVSRLFSGERLLAPPVPAFALLRREDGAWRFASSQYATDDEGLARALRALPEQGT